MITEVGEVMDEVGVQVSLQQAVLQLDVACWAVDGAVRAAFVAVSCHEFVVHQLAASERAEVAVLAFALIDVMLAESFERQLFAAALALD